MLLGLENKSRINKTVLLELLFSLVTSFCIITICSRSSFLYPYNNWDDANSYFSVGKALFNGRMPYRDVFDQKGMWLYFMYGLCYLVSHRTFMGVYIMEILLGTVSIYFIYRILKLYIRQEFSFILAPVTVALCYSSISFYWGGSAEEMMLPLMLVGLFLMMRYLHGEEGKTSVCMRDIDVLIAGLMAGFIANIKFNSLGFYFAWMMLLFFIECARKQIAKAFIHCLIFLAGMFIPFVPWIIYFAANNGLMDWYNGYIYMNVFLYSDLGAEGTGVYSKGYFLVKMLYWLIQLNAQYFILILMGFAYIFFSKQFAWIEKIVIYVLFGLLYIGIYIGGVELRYYAFPLCSFTVFGAVAVGKLLERTKLFFQNNAKTDVILRPVVIAAQLIAVIIALALTTNRSYMSTSKDEIFLTSFAQTIEDSGIENPTLLNCNCLDAGLYTVSGIVPNCRWFQTQTLPIGDVWHEQIGYMTGKKVDFVLVVDYEPEGIDGNYELVNYFDQKLWDSSHEYYLYQVIR